ncbi:MAG: YuiA family protein [Thermoactinomyces sp.]
MTTVSEKKCDYCNGQGYVQLLLGGTENCYACGGTGKEKKQGDKDR